MRKLTNEEFLTKVKEVHGDEYTPLEEYKGAKIKLRVRHNKCGEVWLSTPDNLYNGGCIECGYKDMKKKQRKTNDKFLEEVYNLVGDDYTFLEKYVNTDTNLKVKHNSCGHEYSVKPRDFLTGNRCPIHRNERISKAVTKNHQHFLKRLGDSIHDEYSLLGEYVNSREKIKVAHLPCGTEYFVSPQHLLNGRGCPSCKGLKIGKKLRKTHEQFLSDLGSYWFEEYELLSTYTKQKGKVNVLHKKCNRVYSSSADSILSGSGCSFCKISRGEKEVAKFLTENNIDFDIQQTFPDCVYKEKLSYDFSIKTKEKIVALIEYQGVQHYKPSAFFGGLETYNKQVIRDKIKKDYAKSKNIPLLEIRYDENVNEVLSKLIPR